MADWIYIQWGYDSQIMRFFGPVGEGNIHDHARSLIRDLSLARIEEHQVFRPIIFFAHSQGGLVVKDVSISLHQRPLVPISYHAPIGFAYVVSRGRKRDPI